MNATQCGRAARARTSSGRYRTAAFAGLAAAAIVCGPAAGQNEGTMGDWIHPPYTGPFWETEKDLVVQHAANLPDGSILVWQLPDKASLWDPVLDTLTEMGTSFAINCSGHVGLPDGTILFAGGSAPTAESKVFSFEGCILCPWLSVDDMNYARFYPTLTTLPNGQVVATSGRDAGGVPLVKVEIFTFDPDPDPPVGTWQELAIQTWGIARTYPHMFVVPDVDPDVHKVFFSSSHRPNDFDISGTTYMLDITDIENATWLEVGGDPLFHSHDGSAVMYEPGKVLKSGGVEWPEEVVIVYLDDTATINLDDTTPLWQSEVPMMFARAGHNLVLLPDGKILAVGGENEMGAVEDAEWFDPDPLNPHWELLAEMDFGRAHHSTAVLLANGKVLSVGGEGFLPNDPPGTAEIFLPPYLFDGNNNEAQRPAIGFAPRVITYGTTFHVAVLAVGGDPIQRVTLLRLGAATHGFDQNQRFMELTFTPSGPGGLDIDPPLRGNQMPPGEHLLFVISANGVPSVAKYVRLTLPPSP